MSEKKIIKLKPGESVTIVCENRSDRLSFQELMYEFNKVLSAAGKNQLAPLMAVTKHLELAYTFADDEFDYQDSKFFDKANYPDIVDRFGDDDSTLDIGYNAMQSWLMAMYLARLVPNKGNVVNTQTQLFRMAYQIGGGSSFPLFGKHTMKADPYATREAAARIYAYISVDADCNKYRDELGGQMIPASCWGDLEYANIELSDAEGRKGYETENIGWLVNSFLFLPNAPEPRVSGTTVCNLLHPDYVQPESQFDDSGNYQEDERVYNEMVKGWNMMAQTPLGEWQSYTTWTQNRLVNVMATPPCTYQYMFGKPKPVRLVLDNGELPIVDGYPRYVFEECESSDLVIDGPFSDLAGIFRYNVEISEMNERERAISTILEIADNFRFPIQDPNYGRCRPGCYPARTGKERNPIHGAAENELYNVSIAAMVADTETQKQKMLAEDGFAADSPRSYVSGHSTQVMTMALLLGTMNPCKLNDYCRRAYEYSENRAIGRFHWQSDCIYGRLIATMALPIIQAMEGLQSGLKAIKNYVDNPQPEPVPETDCIINIVINNTGNRTLTLNGELCLVLANPDKNGVYYGWQGLYNRTSHIRFSDPIDIAPDSSVGFYGISMENEEIKVRGRNLVEASVIPATGKPSNVMLYDTDGVSETFVPEPADSDIIFDDGVTLNIIVK